MHAKLPLPGQGAFGHVIHHSNNNPKAKIGTRITGMAVTVLNICFREDYGRTLELGLEKYLFSKLAKLS